MMRAVDISAGNVRGGKSRGIHGSDRQVSTDTLPGRPGVSPASRPILHRLPINSISDISPAAVFYRNRVALCRKRFRFATKCEINNRSFGSATTRSLDLRSVKRISSKLGTGNKDYPQRCSSTPSEHLRYGWKSFPVMHVVTIECT